MVLWCTKSLEVFIWASADNTPYSSSRWLGLLLNLWFSHSIETYMLFIPRPLHCPSIHSDWPLNKCHKRPHTSSGVAFIKCFSHHLQLTVCLRSIVFIEQNHVLPLQYVWLIHARSIGFQHIYHCWHRLHSNYLLRHNNLFDCSLSIITKHH